MAVLGIDDTDSRTEGMCTTWVATEVARRLPGVNRLFLVRLNPAVEHKTRGNGAVAIETAGDLDDALDVAASVIREFAVIDDPKTNPGVVGVPDVPDIRGDQRAFAREAVRSIHGIEAARAVIEDRDLRAREWGNGRGLVGSMAAVGAVGCYHRNDPTQPVLGDWTHEWLAYREPSRWGSARRVDATAATAAIERWGRAVWDTLDPRTNEAVCVPNSPCPVLYGVRGDSAHGVRDVAGAIESEPVERARRFLTNQGTDDHLRPGTIGALHDRRAYRVAGSVRAAPTTGRGGHVSVTIEENGDRVDCLAFAPTGRFRDEVRRLVEGDRVVVCGEVTRGALKLEKFALVERSLTDRRTPTCPDCGCRLKSAGRGQGYRCRPCGTTAPAKAVTVRDRELEPGWYEVPPGARRHLARPLVRGGYDLPVHPTSA